ncbi:YybS family protein [Desulforamulus aquiferis]|uniref:YybS family protein n=1 Tax=Desulforamulus aquiferis TaxID=1397668 RepID=A0AAW7ZC69_9FIRM|nr:YybS family protein [Desulforamulus aquiferis]MDO7787279.1 YybS family protein [Desulforamulus aquiferis]
MASFRDTRAMVEGAFIAGITAVLGLLGMFIPPFFLVISIIIPIPLAVLVRRRDLRVGVMSLVVSGFLMMVLYPDPLRVLVMFIQFGPLGLVLGLLYKNYVSSGHALVAASLVSVIASITVIILSVLFTGLSLELIQGTMNETMERAFQMYEDAGHPVPMDQQQLFRDSIKGAIFLLPGMYVLSALFSTALTYIVGGKVLVRMNYKVNSLPPFSKWRMPWYAIWGIILGLIFLLAGNHYEIRALNLVGQNLLMLFMVAFFVTGLSVLAYYYKIVPFSKPFKFVLILVVVLYIGFMYLGIIMLGLFDAVFNIRRPLPTKEK